MFNIKDHIIVKDNFFDSKTLSKNKIEDLEKIIHYCELEIKTMKDLKKK